MRAALLLALLACQDEGPIAPALAQPTYEARVVSARVEAGAPVQIELVARSAPGWTVLQGGLEAPGLTIRATGEEGPVRVGEADSHVWRFEAEGPAGSYVITPAPAQATDPSGATVELPAEPLFVDIGVTGPTGGPIADFQAVPPPEGFPWAAAGAGLLATALVGGGLAWWRRRAVAPPPPPPPVPADVAALRAWEAARLAGLEDHPLALELSRVLRVFLEAVTGLPATSGTTREILRGLEDDRRMGPALVIRAAHVLDATDRLKFAREGGGARFFDELDQDFRAVVEALKPRPELDDDDDEASDA